MAAARTPKYSRFLWAGALVGVLVGLVVALSRDTGDDYGRGTVVVYSALLVGFLGALAAGLVAVLLDRRSGTDDGDLARRAPREP